ncbi:hypothetical protein BTW10_02665 [Chromohalobacter japonicus]|uniref:Tyr recombinase domain-containing protein n=1 Tax=Chromohalobacter japonicus TaxID=223900 RepID=A0A1Q8TFD4_9GAMM|nr:tyrosine-type recombinase/integrase [Chromohalobacter japonicus]OLO12393.1 hypothetical protein BTW10_02665 [Chromohalobacter japonicus]
MILTSPDKKNIEMWLGQEMVATGGGVFTPSDNFWRPDPTTQSANVAEAKHAVKEEMQPWLIAALAYYAKERSARTLKGVVGVLKLCANSGFDVLDEPHVISIRNRLSERDFCILRSFIKRWREEYSLIVCPSEQVTMAFYTLKPNEDKGPCPVESMDPKKGPFTVLELQALFSWVNDAYTDDRVSVEQFIYIRLLIATGSRNRQLQQLVFGDIANGHEGPMLHMPKAKDRGFEYRSSFQIIKLAPDLYSALVSYQKLTLQCLLAEQPSVDWKKALHNVPLFRAKGSRGKVITDDVDLHLLEANLQEKFHKQDGSMKALFRGLDNDQAFPVSERTGEKIHLSSHRFRYTLGTDMARMGFSPHAIASALAHRGITSVGKYIKTSLEMSKRIDDKMKTEMAQVVNAFQGRLVTDAAEAINGSYPNKTIRGQSGAIATCGASGGCHLDAPVACYTCSKFQPWIEGPHEEVLERLRLRQQRAIDAGGHDSDAAISFDRPILAVMQVIHQVNAVNRQTKGIADE